ncbi:MAG: DUF952 domain-containing protein [Acidimicrobiia bacterium]
MTEPIYHLAEPQDWAASTDEYRPASFAEEGFIHCSKGDQVSPTAREMFGRRNDLVLLTIEPDALGASLVYEDTYDLGEEFPHVYGPLPTSAVSATGPYLTHLEEGLWLDTRNDPSWMELMLHPEFTEVGRSGRRYGRAETIDASPVDLSVEIPLEDCRMVLIDEDVAMMRYVSRAHYEDGPAAAERTSIWINTNEGWRLRFHQGTPLP